MIDYKKQGKRNKINGGLWENKVQEYFENEGWFVSRFQSNVEFSSDIKEIKVKVVKGETVHHITGFKSHEIIGKLVNAKASRYRLMSTGFPDFICWRTRRNLIQITDSKDPIELEKLKERFRNIPSHTQIILPSNIKITPEPELIGVECKSNGTLSKEEKIKIKWLLTNKVFQKIYVVNKKRDGRRIVPEIIEYI